IFKKGETFFRKKVEEIGTFGKKSIQTRFNDVKCEVMEDFMSKFIVCPACNETIWLNWKVGDGWWMAKYKGLKVKEEVKSSTEWKDMEKWRY
ncbi:unnamed protein product, partial [marine sediment metagenome]